MSAQFQDVRQFPEKITVRKVIIWLLFTGNVIYLTDSRTTLRLAEWFCWLEHPLSGLGQHCGELIANED